MSLNAINAAFGRNELVLKQTGMKFENSKARYIFQGHKDKEKELFIHTKEGKTQEHKDTHINISKL